jgi:hypothetical protein
MSIDRGVIEAQLEDIGEGSRWWDKREMRDLPEVLHADERILAISRGKVARIRVVGRPWLILVTDRRLLCMRSGAHGGWRQFEVPARQLGRVSLRVGPFRGRVRVDTASSSYRMLVPRDEAYRLERALSGIVPPAKPSGSGFEPGRMVRRVIDHVLALPAAALGPDVNGEAPPRRQESRESDERLEALEAEVEGLREQVEFLEELLRQRHLPVGEAPRTALPQRGAPSDR